MKSQRLSHACLLTLPILLALLALPIDTLAQLGGRPAGARPFVDSRAPMPREVTRKPLRGATGRADVSTPQTIDLTPSTPLVDDANPFWSRDEQFLVFDSNRADLAGTTVSNPPTVRHIYRIRAGGSAATALTGPLSSGKVGQNASQTEPALNPSGTTLVYVEQTATTTAIIEYNLLTGQTRQVVNLPNQRIINVPGQPIVTFTALNHPEYLGLSTSFGVMFAGQTAAGGPYKLYHADLSSGNITQLTFGVSDDRNPTLGPDPDKPIIAFDSNRTDAAGNGTKATRDIWVIGTNPNIQNAARVTNFQTSDNIEPAWSTNKIDLNQQIIQGQQLLAFATTRYDPDGSGNATGVNPNGTHEIYWLKAEIDFDPANPSVFTVSTPESDSNPALKLVTSDPSHIYDDRNPTWPQFIATYRVAYDSDRTFYNAGTNTSGPAGQPRDIFVSTLFDLNAPTLIRFDPATGDQLSVVPRKALPGQTVKISAKVADLETGIRDVWVQIKNPNSKYQAADNVEHKVFVSQNLNLDANNVAARVPVEYESERIFIGKNPADPRAYTYAAPRYLASVDDFFAFSGLTGPPDESWLQLEFESRDPATGVATYSATWKTDNIPTDYYIDLIVYDNALNPFARSDADRAVNWKIYDNIYGFSTQEFTGLNGILFVSDHAAGQKFFSSRFGTANLVNVQHTFWGTESWLTDIDISLLPSQYVNGTTVNPLALVLNNLGVKSYGAFDPSDPYTALQQDAGVLDGTKKDGADLPVTQRYDIWRVLCRGPVPATVLSQYLPRTITQPPDVASGETAERVVQVADRCVIWHAPYAGNVFAGPGAITDTSTQSNLAAFVAAGGRLVVNGQDVAWALTLDGSAPNSFVSNVLRAQYVRDTPNTVLWRIPSGLRGLNGLWGITAAYGMTAAGPYNPISHDPWVGAPGKYLGSSHHLWPGPPDPPYTEHYISADTLFLGGGADVNTPRLYNCPGNFYPDLVTPAAGAVADVQYGGNLGAAILHYGEPFPSGSGAKVVYTPCGLEGIFPDFHTIPNSNPPIIHLSNRRAELLHNMVCWLRTGRITGTVLSVEGATPLANVLVRLSNRLGPTGNPITAYTALTDNSGNFAIQGVEPEDYEITAFVPGYQIQKRTFVTVHGGASDRIDFRMTPAQPAQVTGRVTEIDGTTPIPGATVTATSNDPNNPVTLSATTDANGDYTIDRVPASISYTVDATAPGYGDSIPDNRRLPATGVVQPSQSYTGYDFQLKPIPGRLAGRVVKGLTDVGVKGATVTATKGATNVTATTGDDGSYSFPSLDPGTWVLVATAAGFRPSVAISVVVVSDKDVVAELIRLFESGPGAITGLVTRTSDGQPEGGVTIEARDANGTLAATATTSPAKAPDGTNYKLENVPSGVTYTVTARKPGFSSVPASRSVTVDVDATGNGKTVTGVDFQLEPLHTFPASLSMVSSPYDYPATDVGTLLNIPPADRTSGTFRLATWTPTGYVLYATPPADRFRLGRGYFLAYKTNIALSTEGTLPDQNAPFDIPLQTGWNMIGDPFLIDIDWTKVKVVDAGTVIDHAAAVSRGLIGAGLYSYITGGYVLDFKISPWKGYWVRAFKNVSLRIDLRTDQYGRAAASAPVAASRAVLQGSEGWALNLRLNVGALRDEDNYLGQSSRAAEGFDHFKTQKPPVFGEQYAYLSFDHEDWGDKSGSYGVDLRSSTPGTRTWTVTVRTAGSTAPATLTWPNAATLRRNLNLTLTDLTSGETRSLRNSSSYTWTPGDKPAVRRFKVELTSATLNSGLRISDVVARQSGRGAAAGSVSISYNLSASANVEIRILGSTGSPVRRLTSGRVSRAAGINSAVWDQKDDRGVAMPAGAYFVEIRAQSADGRSTVRAQQPLLLLR